MWVLYLLGSFFSEVKYLYTWKSFIVNGLKQQMRFGQEIQFEHHFVFFSFNSQTKTKKIMFFVSSIWDQAGKPCVNPGFF